MWAMKKGESPVLYGDGSQTRDFTFVKDINRGFQLGMDSDIKFGIFNLGTGNNYTLNELVDLLNRLMKTDIKPTYIENPLKNYVNETLADTSKAEKELRATLY